MPSLPTKPLPPIACKVAKNITQHGETRCDDYAWMKDDNWQEVLRDSSVLRADIRHHLEAENAYYTDSTAHLEELRKSILTEMRGRIKEDDNSVPAPDGPWSYYVRYREGGEYPIYGRIPRESSSIEDQEVLIFDGEAEAGESKFFDIGGISVSPDHRLLAYAVDRQGSEYYDIRVRDLQTGKEFGDHLVSTDGSAVWSVDNAGFFYIERDDNQRPKRVLYHKLGADQAEDHLIYDESDDGMFLGLSSTQSDDWILIDSGDQVTNEIRIISAHSPLSAPILIAPRLADEKYDIEHHKAADGEWFYILTNTQGAVDFKMMRAPVASPGRENWEDCLPYRPGTYIEDFVVYKEYLVREERVDARPRILISDFVGNAHEIVFDEDAYDLSVMGGYEYDTEIVRFSYESPTQPAQVFDYNMRTRERVLLKTQQVPSGHDPAKYVTERLTAVAPDGAEVPVVTLRLKETKVDGSAPVLLYGYGSYGAYIEDGFSTSLLSLVDRGMIYACAHIRGGSAKGRQWYLDGKLDKKMNTFTDFIASAEMLIAKNYTQPGRIVSYGGSAGGLLVGASLNLAPHLWAGVLGVVPFVDVLNTISDETLPLTPPEWPEWGDPIRSQEGYSWIKSYSPYDNIAQDEQYPPVMATGGLSDYRVTYWEPMKWVAKLRDKTAPDSGPFMLRMNMSAGHGGAAARFEALDERAHLYAVALDWVGLS